MLCYDYYVLLSGFYLCLSLLGARVSFLVLGEKSEPIYACLSCKKFFLFLVRIVSLLFCPLQMFEVLGTEGGSSPSMEYIILDNLSIGDDTVS